MKVFSDVSVEGELLRGVWGRGDVSLGANGAHVAKRLVLGITLLRVVVSVSAVFGTCCVRAFCST